ncbi:hypothetical protein [Acidisphaera sp. S103]|uniref:hypothetical protein n=1 Tax=Acidisphaera sp. S103 TaxID=1747223 RepID=UPI00131E9B8E|nr:hypothetical protein [Acidisphaera sp. S103]
MTIVVCVRVNDGIVLASDSATSFIDPTTGMAYKVYNHADKIFNLIKGQPIGAMTYGSGSIGTASISTLSKDLRKLLVSPDLNCPYKINIASYTIEEVAQKALSFFGDLYKKEYVSGIPNYYMGYRICGYSTGCPFPEAWEIGISDAPPVAPWPLYNFSDPFSYGPRWAGEVEALDRLILGVGSRFSEALQANGLSKLQADNVYMRTVAQLRVDLHMAAMPIQDAIDLAKFLAETSARFAHFSIRAPTVGGPVELATVTKHEGFKWVNRKHYYTTDLNPGG